MFSASPAPAAPPGLRSLTLSAIDSSRTHPSCLPYSISAIDTLPRAAGGECGHAHGRSLLSAQLQQHSGGGACKQSPFTCAPAEVGAAFAGLYDLQPDPAQLQALSCAGCPASRGAHGQQQQLQSQQQPQPLQAPQLQHLQQQHGSACSSACSTELRDMPSLNTLLRSHLSAAVNSPRDAGCCGLPSQDQQPQQQLQQQPACCGASPGGSQASNQGCPPHGAKAVCGKRSTMEDTYAVQTNFFDLTVEVPGRGSNSDPLNNSGNNIDITDLAPGLLSGDGSAASTTPTGGSAGGAACSGACSPPGSEGAVDAARLDLCIAGHQGEMLHFFGVYDGHGGSEAAQHCANRLHLHLHEALHAHMASREGTSAAPPTPPAASAACEGSACRAACVMCGGCDRMDTIPEGGGASKEGDSSKAAAAAVAIPAAVVGGPQPCSDDAEAADKAMEDAFASSDGSAASLLSQSAASAAALARPPTFPEAALREAFIKTDEEFAADAAAGVTGSTAVVALLGTRRIWVGNCGDSRAVLRQAGKAIQLTEDHKPERKDEAERVEKAGGHVLYWNGHRVMGILAMTRAIGDHGLRPYIIPEPEITVVDRTEDDEFLLLASDGLWDVMSNQEATDLASRCLQRALEKGASRKAAVRIAASVLTKAAIDRGSKDNVTAVMVDLFNPFKRAKSGEVTLAPAAAACPPSVPPSAADAATLGTA